MPELSHAIAARGFGTQKRLTRESNQVAAPLHAVGRIARQPDADRKVQHLPGHLKIIRREAKPNTLSQLERLFVSGHGHENRKLRAAITRHQITDAAVFEKEIGAIAQQHVAGMIALFFVHDFEVVDIQKQTGHIIAVARGPRELFHNAHLKVTVRVNARQLIHLGLHAGRRIRVGSQSFRVFDGIHIFL